MKKDKDWASLMGELDKRTPQPKTRPGPQYNMTEMERNYLEMNCVIEDKAAKMRKRRGITADVHIYDNEGKCIALCSFMPERVGNETVAMGKAGHVAAGLGMVAKLIPGAIQRMLEHVAEQIKIAQRR
jgi:hypothetical protein